MPSFHALVEARLEALGLRQKHLAERLEIDSSRLSKLLLGNAPLQLDDAERWAEALQFSGDEAVAFVDDMHVAAASERVQALVERMRTEMDALAKLVTRYRSRVGEARFLLDHAEPIGAAPQVLPGADLDAAELLRLIAEIATRAAQAPDVHQVRRVADGDPPAT